jgi:nicotinate phosphoribosyltransferase
MSQATLTVDAYQLTTLLAHAESGRLRQRVTMSFFFRKLPKGRNYVVFCGLRSLLQHAAQMRLDGAELATLLKHPVIGPALAARPETAEALRALDGFDGDIDALPEGTLAFAGPALRSDGKPFTAAGAPIHIYTSLVQIRTDMLRAKLIETPWLGRINHLSMVASKAARVVDAAKGKPVLEFGARRTHPDASVDVAYAAYLAGCVGSSNVAAQHKYGVPTQGTMDHFFVQASERPGVPIDETEREAFAAFARVFPDNAILLVDTYDTERGIKNAVAATGGKLAGIRIDSNVTVENLKRARKQLTELGAPQARILVSDALEELRVQELRDHADAFGVGENISCSPDAATGIGAVAKLVVNGYGKITMKFARGSGKATLPGELQVHRYPDHDLVALADEAAPPGGRALLSPVWRGRGPVGELPSLEESRRYLRDQLEHLPPAMRAVDTAASWPLVASDGLVERIESLVKEAGL